MSRFRRCESVKSCDCSPLSVFDPFDDDEDSLGGERWKLRVFPVRWEAAGVDTGNNGREEIRVNNDRSAGVRSLGIRKIVRNMEVKTRRINNTIIL